LKLKISLVFAAMAWMLMMAQRPSPDANVIEFTKDNQLLLPRNYREWIFLSAGLGMTYGPAADENRDRGPMFENVFVNPVSYQSFLATGKWPDKTMLMLEIRSSVSKGSINNAGHYQGEVVAVEANVKDSSRFDGNGWAFFAFGQSKTGRLIPKSGECYTCHKQKGAVDNTFVQFYPTLLKVAKEKGTLNPAYVSASAAEGH